MDKCAKSKNLLKQNTAFKSPPNNSIDRQNEIDVEKSMTPSEKQDKSIGRFVDSISTFAKEALERGGGRACVATHGTGCRHYGILDMKLLDRQNFLYYSKKGGWLEGKYCLNCNVLTNDMCMDKVSKSYLRYC